MFTSTMRRFNSRSAALLVLVAFIIIGAVVWQTHRELGLQDAFWQAIRHDLQEKGLVCTISQTSGTAETNQVISLDLIHKSAKGTTTIKNQSGVVTSEELDIGSSVYIRFTAITQHDSSGQSKGKNFSKVLNVWAKNDGSPGSASSSVTGINNKDAGMFSRTVLGNCIVPLAFLPADNADSLAQSMRKNNIFKTDMAPAAKAEISGQPVYTYNVMVQPEEYVSFMKQVASAYGLKDLNTVDASGFAGRQEEPLTFYVSRKTARILEIDFPGRKHLVSFSDYGTVPQLDRPQQTITQGELQKKLFEAEQ